MPDPVLAHQRARVAALRKHRGPDDPETIAATRELRAEKLAQHVRKIVDLAPPLTTEQRARIAALLRAPGGGGR